jgi:hypothetical protein
LDLRGRAPAAAGGPATSFIEGFHDSGIALWGQEPNSSDRSCELAFAAISSCGGMARSRRKKYRQRQLAATRRWFMESCHILQLDAPGGQHLQTYNTLLHLQQSVVGGQCHSSWKVPTIRASRPGGHEPRGVAPRPLTHRPAGANSPQPRARSAPADRRPGIGLAPFAGAALAGRQELLAPRQGALDLGAGNPGALPACAGAWAGRPRAGGRAHLWRACRAASEVWVIIDPLRLRCMESSHDSRCALRDHEPSGVVGLPRPQEALPGKPRSHVRSRDRSVCAAEDPRRTAAAVDYGAAPRPRGRFCTVNGAILRRDPTGRPPGARREPARWSDSARSMGLDISPKNHTL